jgi:hypothetical protein
MYHFSEVKSHIHYAIYRRSGLIWEQSCEKGNTAFRRIQGKEFVSTAEIVGSLRNILVLYLGLKNIYAQFSFHLILRIIYSSGTAVRNKRAFWPSDKL